MWSPCSTMLAAAFFERAWRRGSTCLQLVGGRNRSGIRCLLGFQVVTGWTDFKPTSWPATSNRRQKEAYWVPIRSLPGRRIEVMLPSVSREWS